MYRSVLIVPFILTAGLLRAQEVDTVLILRTLRLEAQVDSLQGRLNQLDSTLQRLKYEQLEGMDITRVLSTISDEDVEAVPEDQRSRRKRLDALLKAITDRPGQLRFNGDVTGILQWNADESFGRTTGVGSFDIFAHTSLGENTLLFLNLEAVGGSGPNKNLKTFSSLNADGASPEEGSAGERIKVKEAWAEFLAVGEALKLTVGKIDLSNYFDNNAMANDETAQFISGSFVNSAALPFPASTPGLRLRTSIARRFYVQIGISTIDNSGDRLFDALFKLGSVGFKVFPDTDWEGNVRIYGYQHPAVFNARGYGFSFDQSVSKLFTVFARWNENSSKLKTWFGISSAWSMGARVATFLDGRRMVFAFAYGEIKPAVSHLLREKILEVYVRHQLNKWVYLSPHFQILRNPLGISGEFFFLGFRSQFNF